MTLEPHVSDEQLSAQLDGALDAVEAAEVSAHLVACGDCGARLDQLRATSRAVGGLPAEEPPRPVDFGFLARGAVAPGLRDDVRSAPPPAPSFLTRFLRARTPAWATAGLAVAAVLVLVLALAPGLRIPSRSAGGAAGSALGGGTSTATTTAPGATGSSAAPHGAAPQDNAAAPGNQAQRGPTNLRSVTVPSAGGLTLTVSTPSDSARRGDVVPVAVRLGGAGSDQALSQYSLTTRVVTGQQAPPGTAGGTVVGSATGVDLTVRGGGSQDFVFQWLSSLGTPGPGSYTLVATLVNSGQAVSVSIPITLS